MTDTLPHALLDLIYDAALDRAAWPDMAHRLARALGSHAGGMLVSGAADEAFQVGLDPDSTVAYLGHFARRNPMNRPRTANRVTLDHQRVPRPDLVRSEFFNDFMRPFEVGRILTIELDCAGGQYTSLDVVRPPGWAEYEPDAVALAEALQPHLIRAFHLTRRLSGGAGTGLADLMAAVNQPLILADGAARILLANPAASALLAARDGLADAGGTLSASAAQDARDLHRLIGLAAEPDDALRQGGSMRLRRPSGLSPLAAVVAPLGRERTDLFAPRRSALVWVNDPEARARMPPDRLRALFDLTQAEARVALELLAGHDVGAVSDRLGVTGNTVRAQLARIFVKTGVNRQAELLRLLTRIDLAP